MSYRLARTLGNVLSSGGPRARLFVFGYHQVLAGPDPLRAGEPDREQFIRDLDLIGSVFKVLPLAEAVEKLAEGKLPARAACITFDDGYENNYSIAAECLEHKGLPATIFVAAHAVDRGVMWNDLVIEAVARAGGNPDLSGLGEIGQSAASGEGLTGRLLGRLKYLPVETRWESAKALYQANAGRELPRLMMTRANVADLAQRGFDIGGHTVHHPILEELDDDTACREIADGAGWIEEVTGRRPVTFAYPNGIPGRDFDARHEAMVAEAGFRLAVSTEWGAARRTSNRFRIPRIGPWWRQGAGLVPGMLRSYLRSYL